jgi:hypothetical protein
MTWGLASALMEEGLIASRTGAFGTHDQASYLVSVHADIPETTRCCWTASTTKRTYWVPKAPAS